MARSLGLQKDISEKRLNFSDIYILDVRTGYGKTVYGQPPDKGYTSVTVDQGVRRGAAVYLVKKSLLVKSVLP